MLIVAGLVVIKNLSSIPLIKSIYEFMKMLNHINALMKIAINALVRF